MTTRRKNNFEDLEASPPRIESSKNVINGLTISYRERRENA